VGYVKIESFEQPTVEEVRKALSEDQLDAARLRGLVLDLRDNPGGLLSAAVEAAALFLKPGQLMASVRGRSGSQEELRVLDGAKPLAASLAVVINGRTASAAEIVAGALQHHGRAKIVGAPSFGKGLVQRVFPLPESTGLALTTALYFTPGGRSIQRRLPQLPTTLGAAEAGGTGEGGIVPDVAAELEALTPFRVALEAGSSFLSFAQRYTAGHKIPAGFEVTSELLDEFQLYLSEHRIRPSLSEWSANREFVRSRLKQEIYNLAFGVAKGDEVEAQRDAQIQAAVRALNLR
jgi:carboxyl-terminal processing protease